MNNQERTRFSLRMPRSLNADVAEFQVSHLKTSGERISANEAILLLIQEGLKSAKKSGERAAA